jgi:hypothetical protein
MKRFYISAIAAIAMIGSAHADPVSVTMPKAPVSQAEAKAYVIELDQAVKKVCRRAAAPMIGLAFYSYLECIKATRAEVAKKDTTGLYALRDSKPATVIAAK